MKTPQCKQTNTYLLRVCAFTTKKILHEFKVTVICGTNVIFLIGNKQTCNKCLFIMQTPQCKQTNTYLLRVCAFTTKKYYMSSGWL